MFLFIFDMFIISFSYELYIESAASFLENCTM